MEALMGMLGFWTLEVSSLLWIFMLFNFFLSGQMFPLSILPPPWDTIALAIPLQFLAYFPGRRVPAKDHRPRDVAGAGDSSGLGRVLHLGLPRGVLSRRAAVQRVRRVRSNAEQAPPLNR